LEQDQFCQREIAASAGRVPPSGEFFNRLLKILFICAHLWFRSFLKTRAIRVLRGPAHLPDNQAPSSLVVPETAIATSRPEP
jgi:hypothetical protein